MTEESLQRPLRGGASGERGHSQPVHRPATGDGDGQANESGNQLPQPDTPGALTATDVSQPRQGRAQQDLERDGHESVEHSVNQSNPAASSDRQGPPPQPAAHPDPAQPPGNRNVAYKQREWKSWKIKKPWLLFLLVLETCFVIVILVLGFISKRDSGFANLGDAPAFLARDPAVEQAIWAQGIFYTALPAFIMTLFQTCWHSSVAALAKRQPYVELRKLKGGPARTTILLDYPEPFALSWVSAVKNEHYWLAACMLSSATVAFLVVPLTSFLFTTAQFDVNNTFPLSVETAFNTSILDDYPNFPNLRFMDTAAAIHVQGANPPPWTNAEYAFPSVARLSAFVEGNATFESSAYSAHADCKYLDEHTYRKTVSTPEESGIPAISIFISANDRGCQISNNINFRTSPESPKTFIRSWATWTCPAHAGWSRFSFLMGRVTTDQKLANFSLVSCVPSYRESLGNLTVNWNGNTAVPDIKAFSATNVSEVRAGDIWRFFEMGFQSPGCYDPGSDVDTNQFGLQVYWLASKRMPTSPLLPNAIIDAAQTMFATMYAVFTSLHLLQPTDAPVQRNGSMSVQITRLIVVPPIAYAIIGVLLVVAGLNVALFFETQKLSILSEEPVGLLGAAAILHKSTDIVDEIDKLARDGTHQGQIVHSARENPGLREGRWRFKNGVLIRGDQTELRP